LVTIDGQVATLAADGSFDGMVTLKEGSNVIAIVATNKSGHSTDAQIGVVAGKFGDDVPDALAVRVSNQALDVGCKAAAPLIVADLQKLNGKQLAKDTVSPFGGVSITTTVTLDSITAKNPDVKVEGTSSGLAASLGVTNFDAKLPIEITASVFGANIHLNHTLDLHFNSFSAKGTLGLSKTASGTLQVDASGLSVDYAPTLAADILGQQAVNDLNNVLRSLSSIIPGSPKLQFDEVGIVNKVIDLVWQSGLKKTVDDRIANMIVTTGLRGLPLSVMGYQATLDYALDTVSVDANGISLSMGLDVALNLPDKHASKGALLVGGQAPALSGNTGIELAVAQDTVNVVLEQAWRKGLLDKTIDESLAQQLGMLLDMAHLQLLLPVLNAVIPSNAALELQVCPGAAPLVTLGSNGAATVEVTEMNLSAAFTFNGKKTVLFATDVHATIPATFAYTNGALALTLAKPTFVFDLEKSILPLPKIGVENVLDFVVPFAVEFAAGHFLGPIPVPQVSVLGATVQVSSLGTAGAQKDFLEVGLSVK
ncbi:MAG TPA: hypothetical protein VFF73_31370, partial [Planctomycetota bacterium]|nr:hypothetical protein [Planctomycetota bacterium]